MTGLLYTEGGGEYYIVHSAVRLTWYVCCTYNKVYFIVDWDLAHRIQKQRASKLSQCLNALASQFQE